MNAAFSTSAFDQNAFSVLAFSFGGAVTAGFSVGGPTVYDVFPIIGIAELYNVRHRTH